MTITKNRQSRETACYLSMWNNARALELSAMAGAMPEMTAESELKIGNLVS